MNRLKNKEILIGREPGNGRLLISMKVNGQAKRAVIGQLNSVPDCVSRCNPEENVAHCKINVDSNGNMKITNLKPENQTFVNGLEVRSRDINVNSIVTLGKDRYPINVGNVLESAKKLVGTVVPPPPPPKEPLSIKHLEKVWNEYECAQEAIARKQMEKGRRRMIPVMASSISAGLAGILALSFSVNSLYVTLPITLLTSILWIKIYGEKDTTIEDRKAADENLYDNYVCPHKGCHHFVGKQPYRVLKQNNNCPYCKGGWLSDE